MIESQYTTNVHKRLAPNIYAWKINDNYAGGVPDAFYRDKETTTAPLWVEYKFLKHLPKRPTTRVVPNLSAQQLQWLLDAHRAGEKVAVIIGVESSDLRGVNGFVLETPDEWKYGISSADAASKLRGYAGVAEYVQGLLAK